MATATADARPGAAGKGQEALDHRRRRCCSCSASAAAAPFYVMKRNVAAAQAQDDGMQPTLRSPTTRISQPPTYLALDPFVVNLADRDVERYAQIAVTLQVDDPEFAEQMKAYMPSIRNSILLVLAHKSSQELLERAGKDALAAEIMREAVRPMGIEIDPETTTTPRRRREEEAQEAGAGAQPGDARAFRELHHPMNALQHPVRHREYPR